MQYESILDGIGDTPLVRLGGSGGARLYAKLELMNPFGHKDRFARSVLLKAKREGRLKDGDVIIESSSGTLALGLTMVGRLLGHEVHIVTDPRTDKLTLAKLRALGATVHMVDRPSEHGWQGARLEQLHRLLDQYPGAFWPEQYSNPENPAAFSAVTEELLEALGRVDVMVAPVGSGGLVSGTGRALKRINPDAKVIAVDVVGSVIFDQPHNSKRLLNGVGNSLVPANVDHGVVDEVHWVNDQEGFSGTLRLARHEQIFAGGSSGAAYLVAQWVAAQLPEDRVVVVLLPDRGDRYYETIYDEQFQQVHRLSADRIPSAPETVPYGTPVTAWSCAVMPRR